MTRLWQWHPDDRVPGTPLAWACCNQPPAQEGKRIAAEMKAKIQKDFESHGWKWQETIPKCAHTSAAMPERMSAASLHRGGHAGRMLAEPEKHSATREASAHSQPTHQTT